MNSLVYYSKWKGFYLIVTEDLLESLTVMRKYSMIELLIRSDFILSTNEEDAENLLGGARDLDNHHLWGNKNSSSNSAHDLDENKHENDREKFLQVSDFIYHILRRLDAIRKKYNMKEMLDK